MDVIKKPDTQLLIEKTINPLVYKLQEKFKYLRLNQNTAIFKREFDNYYIKAIETMNYHKLDRHKLASIICISVYKADFLSIYEQDCQDHKRLFFANEYLAVHSGLRSMRMYIIKRFFSENQSYLKYQKDAIENFIMEFPDKEELICDKMCYSVNLSLAMRRSFQNGACFDMWSYAFIFFHLEQYNYKRLKKFCEERISLIVLPLKDEKGQTVL